MDGFDLYAGPSGPVEVSDLVDPAGPGAYPTSFAAGRATKFDCEPRTDLVGSRSPYVLLVPLQDLRSA